MTVLLIIIILLLLTINHKQTVGLGGDGLGLGQIGLVGLNHIWNNIICKTQWWCFIFIFSINQNQTVGLDWVRLNWLGWIICETISYVKHNDGAFIFISSINQNQTVGLGCIVLWRVGLG